MPVSAATGGLRERHKRERRERILGAIRELLREAPDEVPTVERVAEVADLSPATVFNLLGPRERQWAALGEVLMRELDERLAAATDDDPRDEARRIAGETAELFIADAAVSRHLLNSPASSGALLRENPVPRLREALRRAQEVGMLRSDVHAEALAGHVATACGGALRQWAAGQISDAAFRKRVRFAVDVAFAAGAGEDRAAELSAPLRRGRRGSR
jgi:AcrR family transcriptional regulator